MIKTTHSRAGRDTTKGQIFYKRDTDLSSRQAGLLRPSRSLPFFTVCLFWYPALTRFSGQQICCVKNRNIGLLPWLGRRFLWCLPLLCWQIRFLLLPLFGSSLQCRWLLRLLWIFWHLYLAGRNSRKWNWCKLCFPLYVCSREIVKAYKPYLDELGLT